MRSLVESMLTRRRAIILARVGMSRRRENMPPEMFRKKD
jgi:hypothetical protein